MRDLTAAEAAYQLGMSVWTLHRRRRAGEFPGAYLDGVWKFPEADVVAYRERRQKGLGTQPQASRVNALVERLARRIG